MRRLRRTLAITIATVSLLLVGCAVHANTQAVPLGGNLAVISVKSTIGMHIDELTAILGEATQATTCQVPVTINDEDVMARGEGRVWTYEYINMDEGVRQRAAVAVCMLGDTVVGEQRAQMHEHQGVRSVGQIDTLDSNLAQSIIDYQVRTPPEERERILENLGTGFEI